MKYEIAEPVTAELHHHEHGAVRLALEPGVHDITDPGELVAVEALLVPAGLATPSPTSSAVSRPATRTPAPTVNPAARERAAQE
jgi:hypothetical protein